MPGVASFVGELVDMDLHQHQQSVEAYAMAGGRAARSEPVADGVQATVEPRGADDVVAFVAPLLRPTVELCSEGVVSSVNPGTDLDQDEHKTDVVDLIPSKELSGR